MMILLPNMIQSMFIFGFNVQYLCTRANRVIITDDIGQALANDVEGVMLFINGCTDSERVIAKLHTLKLWVVRVHSIRSRIPDSVLDFDPDKNLHNNQIWALLVLSKKPSRRLHLFCKTGILCYAKARN